MKAWQTRTFKGALMAGVTLLTSTIVRAGTADIGGGAGIVCRTQNGKIKSAELLDLFEGQTRYKYVIPDVKSNDEAYARFALSRLAFAEAGGSFASANPGAYLTYVMKRAEAAPAGVSLSRPDDLGSEVAVYSREGCSIETIGYREKDGSRMTLRISPAVFGALSPTHKAAFWVHEALYSFYQSNYDRRISEQRGTREIRRLTAALFARNTDLDELVKAARFLFVPQDGTTYVDEPSAGATVGLAGRTNPMDRDLDILHAEDAGKFVCSSNGGLISSRPVLNAGLVSLVLTQTNDDCFSKIQIQGLRAQLSVNGRDILEVSDVMKIKLVFLKDHPLYSNFASQARYQRAARTSTPNLNKGLPQ